MATKDFLFCLSEVYSEDDVRLLHRLIDELARDRAWYHGPPQFVDQTDASSCTLPEDLPVRTVGGYVEFSAPGAVQDAAAEKHQFEDADFLIERLARYSRERKCELEIEYAGELIGEIENGEISESVAIGFLAEWCRNLP